MKNARRRFQKDPVDVMIHRIAVSDYSSTLREIRHEWGLGDIADAHRYLDYQEELDEIQKESIQDAKGQM